MQLFDPNNPNEKKKIIAAAALFVVAVVVLGYVFFGGSSTKTQTNKNSNNVVLRATPSPGQQPLPAATPDDSAFIKVIPAVYTPPGDSETARNIFAFYEPTPKPSPEIKIPTPTPTPTPPMKITQLNPPSVYARTADFALEVSGEKFTPVVRVLIDGRELPTRFMSAQQVFTTVPASLISVAGTRQVTVQSSDGKLYALPFSLNVMQPPLPNYNYVGIIQKPRANDVAVLQDKGNKDLLNVTRGDLLANRFRVASISEREVVLVDTILKIRHTLQFTIDSGVGQPSRPIPRINSEQP